MTETLIVGLEVHVQLLTKSKIFCGCANRFNPDAPNTQTCPVCLGHPGSLPVMNEEAFRLSLITATAINCEIAPFTKWDRKQYFYPDLPKGYQISQFDLPFSHDGWLEVTSDDGSRRKIRINRAHLEEDAGKNIHDESGRGNDSQVDLNRTGTPLLEIVSEPDIRSAAEAKSYLEELHLLLTFLGVSDCNMQEGSLRCDANVNLHYGEGDEKVATPIVEVKNLNSFRAVEASIEYEAERQRKIFAETGRKLGDPGVSKETRGWDANRNATFGQRGKEEASDYRYFPDPDLIPVTVSREQVEAIKAALPEPPATRRRRFENELGLSAYDADVIVNQGKDLADYYEEVVAVCRDGKQAANWVTQDILREMKERSFEISEFPIHSELLGTIIQRVVDKKITNKSGREVLGVLLEDADEERELTLSRVDEIIQERGLEIVSDTGALDEAIQAAIAESPKAVEDFKAGKQQAVGALIGKVMRVAKGADAKAVREMIIKKLQGMD
ncbi:Asp-tRNA(Asn)/Glu-tRNA(Gln) amidotransferase subunit GatB [Thalassoglobus polymorphus]|uniref:Aspartyl/glutamyl-tRNA(Asn/Gln) amidotransferase subunit B n=1 Tax=Thalassoglobus polymorphus TaxID=2527994 RepID=A0A517QGV5_9PLAN|nr:Asp-tRNA(Asn)/Glu-tRNA(Gln) amidotransferase subunit GatB [Thalassoglobus polymorphus]QDT30860.1 Aspartyl/glutamyl-tRNA(Asn/Gln) amidotransferase subunit B [Thalassoglobus polymorphus]